MNTIHKTSWRQASDNVLEVGCLFSLFVSFLALVAYDFSAWQRIAILIGVNLPLWLITSYRRHQLTHHQEKIYPVELPDSIKIVTAVLDSKQLAFDKTRQGESFTYLITPENITITLSIFNPAATNWKSRSHTWLGDYPIMTQIRIAPNTPDNQPMINSLQQKLDEAFRPQGLPQ